MSNIYRKSKIKDISLKNTQNHQKTQDRKNSIADKKVIENYLKVKKLFHAKARSIEKQQRVKEMKTDIRKHIKNFKSEDKEKLSLRINEFKPKNFLQTKTTAEYTNQFNKPKETNKYYNHLMQKLNEGYAREIAKIIKSSFRKWNDKEKAEFFTNFQTSSKFYEIKN